MSRSERSTRPRWAGKQVVRAVVTASLFAASGCLPAKVPDNLDDTPGPPIVVDGAHYTGVNFNAWIPDGWRVISSEAQAPQAVIMVAPDEKTLIHLMSGKVELGDVEIKNQRNELFSLALADGSTVSALFSSPASMWDQHWAIFEKVRDSVSSH